MKEKFTVAEKTVKLVTSEESEPTDTVALVLAEVDADVDRDLVLGDLATVKKLHEELALRLALGEKFVRKAGRVGKSSL
jgi:hypothetical protein